MECQNSDTPVFIKRLFMECSSDVDWNLLSWNMYDEAELHLGCVLPSNNCVIYIQTFPEAVGE